MGSDELLDKYFETRTCGNPQELLTKQAQWLAALREAAKVTRTPVETLERVVKECYPEYAAKRLAKEMPLIPKVLRKQ